MKKVELNTILRKYYNRNNKANEDSNESLKESIEYAVKDNRNKLKQSLACLGIMDIDWMMDHQMRCYAVLEEDEEYIIELLDKNTNSIFKSIKGEKLKQSDYLEYLEEVEKVLNFIKKYISSEEYEKIYSLVNVHSKYEIIKTQLVIENISCKLKERLSVEVSAKNPSTIGTFDFLLTYTDKMFLLNKWAKAIEDVLYWYRELRDSRVELLFSLDFDIDLFSELVHSGVLEKIESQSNIIMEKYSKEGRFTMKNRQKCNSEVEKVTLETVKQWCDVNKKSAEETHEIIKMFETDLTYYYRKDTDELVKEIKERDCGNQELQGYTLSKKTNDEIKKLIKKKNISYHE